MNIKTTFLVGLCVALVGGVSAAILVNNGGFDINAADWNAAGGGGAWAPSHVPDGGNPGGYITLRTADNTWSVWYQVGTEELAVWGIPAGTPIVPQVDMIDLGTTGNNSVAGLKLESWNGGLINEAASEFVVSREWKTYSFDFIIHPQAESIKFVVTNVNYNGLGEAYFGYDNAAIGFPDGLTPALFPVPTVGSRAVAANFSVLSWRNPEPLNNPADVITCDVWFRESPTPLADPNLVPEQPGVIQVVAGEALDSVDLAERGITLQQDHYYYWKVDVTDPNTNGEPIKIEGFTWSFFTGDVPPTANAGTDQYLWLEDGTATFTLTGSYVDDGRSEVTTRWSLNPLTETDPDTTVLIHDPSALTTQVTVDNTGWFYFDFTVTDAGGSGIDTVNVGVYADACEAAFADPADEPFPGDVNFDCVVDLYDLAILAADWVGCMSEKLGCMP
jgi:hypothetical protein